MVSLQGWEFTMKQQMMATACILSWPNNASDCRLGSLGLLLIRFIDCKNKWLEKLRFVVLPSSLYSDMLPSNRWLKSVAPIRNGYNGLWLLDVLIESYFHMKPITYCNEPSLVYEVSFIKVPPNIRTEWKWIAVPSSGIVGRVDNDGYLYGLSESQFCLRRTHRKRNIEKSFTVTGSATIFRVESTWKSSDPVCMKSSSVTTMRLAWFSSPPFDSRGHTVTAAAAAARWT